MALAETAKLIASLELDPRKFNAGVSSALGGLGKLEGGMGRIGGLAKQGAQNAARNVMFIGAAATAAVGAAVKSGLESLERLENVTSETNAAIATAGLALSADDVRRWALEVETAVRSAVDDKAIQAGANTLIRFGDVAEENLRAAIEVATDLSVKLGGVEQASTSLAKALADPTKATRILRDAGVSLTAEEQKKIKALVEGGDKAAAQALILDRLSERTKGAAAASAGPYRTALNLMSDAAEDARMALAEGFLPVIVKVADRIKEIVSRPENLERLRTFGQTLAGGVDKLFALAEKLPWGSIGSAMELAGTGARFLLDAFTAMPPWVQTAVLTGWGLNKLTGGALGGIVGELGKGLIRGVLGINAAVVNLVAPNVRGLPVTPGGTAAVAGGASRIASAVKVLGAVTIAGASIALLAEEFGKFNEGNEAARAELRDKTAGFLETATLPELRSSLRGIEDSMNTLDPIKAGIYALDIGGVRTEVEATKAALEGRIAELVMAEYDTRTEQIALRGGLADLQQDTVTGTARVATNARNAGITTAAAMRAAATQIVAAIYANRPVINSTTVNNTSTITNRYGPTGDSGTTPRLGLAPR